MKTVFCVIFSLYRQASRSDIQKMGSNLTDFPMEIYSFNSSAQSCRRLYSKLRDYVFKKWSTFHASFHVSFPA